MDSQQNMLYSPQTIAHPGTMVYEYIESYGWSQRELARRTGLTPKTISEICNGKSGISATTALSFEKVFSRPAHFWLNLQANYEEHLARANSHKAIDQFESWASNFPIKEMENFHFFRELRDDCNSFDKLLSFFEVSSPESWRSVWENSRVAFRQTRQTDLSIEAISAWIRMTEIEAENISTKKFDAKKLLSSIPNLRSLTKKKAEDFMPELEEMCSDFGVAVTWVPELGNTSISGCARWLTEDKAHIGLTLRYRTDDQIWFTFFHELGHIVKHRKKYSFILDNAAEQLDDNVIDPEIRQEEEEANRFAEDILIPPNELSVFIKTGDYTEESIVSFASDLDIGPGIVVGRLQSEGELQYYQGKSLKRTFNWEIK